MNPTFEWRSENLASPLALDRFATVSVPLDITGRRSALGGLARSTADRAMWDSVTIARRIEVDAARAYSRAALAQRSDLISGYNTRVVGVSVPLPVFNRNSDARTGARVELAAAEAELRAAENSVAAEVISAVEYYRALQAMNATAGNTIIQNGDEISRIADEVGRELDAATSSGFEAIT